MLLSLMVHSALACGGLVVSSVDLDQIAASDAQQAFFNVGTDAVSVEYRVRYKGDAASFAWVIPVPGVVTAVEEGSEETFTAAETMTAPDVARITYGGSGGGEDDAVVGCGCGADNALKGGDFSDTSGAEDSGITIKGSGYAGGYTYTILAAEDADDFKVWLSANGYDTTISGPSIDDYVADSIGFEWVAVQLVPDAPSTPDGGVLLTPLRIRYAAAEDGGLHVLFPNRMGSTAMVDTTRVEVYVLASGFADVSGWTAPENDYEEGIGDSGYGDADLYGSESDDPEALYEALLLETGGTQTAWWNAWAGAYTDPVSGTAGYLTRYDTIVAPATQTLDAVFTDSGAARDVTTTIQISGYARVVRGVAGLPFLLGGLAAWATRRRVRRATLQKG